MRPESGSEQEPGSGKPRQKSVSGKEPRPGQEQQLKVGTRASDGAGDGSGRKLGMGAWAGQELGPA